MNRHGLSVLQFDRALDIVAGYAANPVGADAVRALEPSDARVWVNEELGRVDEMRTFVVRSEDWTVPPVPDLRDPIGRLALEGSVWEGTELRDAAKLIRSARTTRREILRYSEDYPLLAAVAERLAKLEDDGKAIRRAIDEDDGHVKDGASSDLKRIRSETRRTRKGIVQKLERFMSSLPDRIRVPDASVSIREGRYVIPIRREGRSKVGGIVHDESATGSTLFVEPQTAIDTMNRLRELELEERREVQRILAALTDRLRPRSEALERTLDALVAIDTLYARARYALQYDGRRPTMLSRGTQEYEVVRGFHPLLLAGTGDVVPFDLRLEEGERTLLVSGPNTGGKTVLLKAIGLISAMAQAGIVPPVGPETRLPMIRDVYADIGDEQSIEASLSTFSAHLKNLREVLDEADHETMILIDEIGSGTDPAEGGALAQSILVELTRRGAMTVATSHLGELKMLAAEETGVVNASLQFDSRELRPTYRLVKGVPGRSYGLAIARRLGFPAKIVSRAEEYLPEEHREVGQLLRDIEDKERKLERALAGTEAARGEAKRLRGQLKEREREVRQREDSAERRSRKQARELLMNAREQVEETIRELRETVQRGGADADAFEEQARRARRRIEEAADRQKDEMPALERPGRDLEVADVPEPGSRVRLEATGAVGEVVEVRDGRATVETGGLRLQVSASDITVLEAAEEDESDETKPSSGGGWTGPEAHAVSEIDLRGLRADEVEGRLLPALDAAIQAGLPSLRIIHGKGGGVLREVVTELLERDRRIDSFRLGGPGEGGVGVTIVELE